MNQTAERTQENKQEANQAENREQRKNAPAIPFARRAAQAIERHLEQAGDKAEFNPQDLIRIREAIKKLNNLSGEEKANAQDLVSSLETRLIAINQKVRENLITRGYGQEVDLIEKPKAPTQRDIETAGVNSFIAGMLGQEAIEKLGPTPSDAQIEAYINYVATINPQQLMKQGLLAEALAQSILEQGTRGDITLNESERKNLEGLLALGQKMKKAAIAKGGIPEVTYERNNFLNKAELIKYMAGNSQRGLRSQRVIDGIIARVERRELTTEQAHERLDKLFKVSGKSFAGNLSEGGMATLGLLTTQAQMVTDLFGKVGEITREKLLKKSNWLQQHIFANFTTVSKNLAAEVNSLVRELGTNPTNQNPIEAINKISSLIATKLAIKTNPDGTINQDSFTLANLFTENGASAQAICAVRSYLMATYLHEHFPNVAFTAENQIVGKTGHVRLIALIDGQYYAIDPTQQNPQLEIVEGKDLSEQIKQELKDPEAKEKAFARLNADMMVNFASFTTDDTAKLQLLNSALQNDPDNIMALIGLAKHYEIIDAERSEILKAKLEDALHNYANINNLKDLLKTNARYEAWQITLGGPPIDVSVEIARLRADLAFMGLKNAPDLMSALELTQNKVNAILGVSTDLTVLGADRARNFYQELIDIYGNSSFKTLLQTNNDANSLFNAMLESLRQGANIGEGIQGIFNLSQSERNLLENGGTDVIRGFVEKQIRRVTEEDLFLPGRALPESKASLAQRRLQDIITVLEARASTTRDSDVESELRYAEVLSTAVLKMASMANGIETANGKPEKLERIRDDFAVIDDTEGVQSMSALAEFSEGRVGKITPLLRIKMEEMRSRYGGYLSGARYNLLLNEMVESIYQDALKGTGLYRGITAKNLGFNDGITLNLNLPEHKDRLKEYIRGDTALAHVIFINTGEASSVAQIGSSVPGNPNNPNYDFGSNPYTDWVIQTIHRFDTLPREEREYLYTYLENACTRNLEATINKRESSIKKIRTERQKEKKRKIPEDPIKKLQRDKEILISEREIREAKSVLGNTLRLAQYIERNGLYLIAPYVADFWSNSYVRVVPMIETINTATNTNYQFGIFLQFLAATETMEAGNSTTERRINIGRNKILNSGYADFLMRQFYEESMMDYSPLKDTVDNSLVNGDLLISDPEQYKIFTDFWTDISANFLDEIGIANTFTATGSLSADARLRLAQTRFQIFEKYLSPLINSWRADALSFSHTNPTPPPATIIAPPDHRNFGAGLTGTESADLVTRFPGIFNIAPNLITFMQNMQQYSLDHNVVEEIVTNPTYEHVFRNPLSTIDAPWEFLEGPRPGASKISNSLGKGGPGIIGRYLGDQASLIKARLAVTKVAEMNPSRVDEIFKLFHEAYENVRSIKGYEKAAEGTLFFLETNYMLGMIPGATEKGFSAFMGTLAESFGLEGLSIENTRFRKIFGKHLKAINRDESFTEFINELEHLFGKEVADMFSKIIKIRPIDRMQRVILQIAVLCLVTYIQQFIEQGGKSVTKNS